MISESLRLVSLLFLLVIILIVTFFVRKHRITIKYSLIWYFCTIVLLLFVVFPPILVWLTKMLGIQVASNLLFLLVIAFLFIVTISLTIIVSNQKEQIKLLIQEISILKEKVKNENKFK
ncbi:MAG: DUF2304 domain-containing protein [Bacilli bacterium]|nr:DUF2304 domain-containing protein [Bacilli bacterium]MDD4053959.1 DUF2304 domain-containing protein [Bacilli bacterium]MDD4411425.1 DUF2304 domain-containing protein [Bacilli bacterium]